jgi:hypothetical protein
MRVIDTLEEHRKHPDKSLDEYVKEQRLALGRSLCNRQKIYLDTKYWILLRDYFLGRYPDPIIGELFDFLNYGSSSKKTICPISADVFFEIIQQNDPKTFNCSIKLIDRLSEGVTLISPEDRIRMELLSLVYNNAFGTESCYESDILVWTKLVYVLGFCVPSQTSLSPSDELAIQKAFFDQMWVVSLFDIVENVGIEKICNMPRMPDISSTLNKAKFDHIEEVVSFQDVFLSEIANVLDLLKPEVQDMFVYIYEKFTGRKPSDEELASSDASRLFSNLIYHGYRLKRLTTELPSISIPATLHTAIQSRPPVEPVV